MLPWNHDATLSEVQLPLYKVFAFLWTPSKTSLFFMHIYIYTCIFTQATISAQAVISARVRIPARNPIFRPKAVFHDICQFLYTVQHLWFVNSWTALIFVLQVLKQLMFQNFSTLLNFKSRFSGFCGLANSARIPPNSARIPPNSARAKI